MVLHEKRPNISILAVTSTDDATSATAAPLKSAGGMAVAGNVIVGESAQVRRQMVDGQEFSVAAASTMHVTFTSSVTQQAFVGGIDIAARMSAVGSISGAAWRLYGTLVRVEEFFVHQVHKTEATGVTISAPTWRSPSTFSIDVTNADASYALTCVINTNLSIGSSALLSMTVADL